MDLVGICSPYIISQLNSATDNYVLQRWFRFGLLRCTTLLQYTYPSTSPGELGCMFILLAHKFLIRLTTTEGVLCANCGSGPVSSGFHEIH